VLKKCLVDIFNEGASWREGKPFLHSLFSNL
jgi:hypothetical protein